MVWCALLVMTTQGPMPQSSELFVEGTSNNIQDGYSASDFETNGNIPKVSS